jgi:hypothetical protein
MKFNLTPVIQLAMILIILNSCMPGSKKKVANLAPNAHQVTVVEVIQTSAYSYVRVVEDKKDYWVAINRMEIKEGEIYFWSEGGEMTNFTSKELKRTFPSIFFVQDFTDKPILSKPQVPLTSMAGKQKAPEKPGITVPRAEGGITIAELYSKKNSFQGKTIKIRGEVVKFTPQIMKKNFVHLQDGTKDGDNWDLAITTQDSVTTGDVVIFEGIVTLNKDFGYGYIYDLIVEDAKLKK